MTLLPIPGFDGLEVAILNAMYEVENGTYSSYMLFQVLHPDVASGTEAAAAAFTQTRDTTEQLIAKGLVGGERKKGADGVYFERLKLTTKGEQTAIQVRNEIKKLEKDLPEFMKRAQAVEEEMREEEGE
jgi:hypothetical protein